jgi:hypothetical protein
MSSSQDFCTLAQLKAWLGIASTNTTNDPALSMLISASSRLILSYLARPGILPATYAERYDGQGNQRILLRNWPVLAIASLYVWDRLMPPSPPPPSSGVPSGYLLSPWNGAPPGSMQWVDLFDSLSIFGNYYDRGAQDVCVTYSAGYAVMTEAATVPLAPGPYQVEALGPYGAWGSDLGVTYAASGQTLTSTTNAPNQGQYSVTAGLYLFNAADAGAAVLLSYGYVPFDLAQAAMEIAAERWTYRGRIGIRSQSLAGQETISYGWPGGTIGGADSGPAGSIPAYLQTMIQPYRAVVVPLPA